MKHVFLEIGIRCGEYEFDSKSTHTIGKDEDIYKWADDYSRDFYPNGGERMFDDEVAYYHNGAEVATWVERVEEISKEHLDVLRLYNMP